MKVVLVVKPGHADSGVGRYAVELARALRYAGHEVVEIYPIVPLPAWLLRLAWRWLGWDLQAFFMTYPIWTRYPRADIYHLTSQNLATLLLFCRPAGKIIVTVHDIIPWLTRNGTETRPAQHIGAIFDFIGVKALAKADMLISDSGFTSSSITEHLGIPAHLIQKIYLGLR